MDTHDQTLPDDGKERHLKATADATAAHPQPSDTKASRVKGLSQGVDQVADIDAEINNPSNHSTSKMPPIDENQQSTDTIATVESEPSTHGKEESEASTSKDETNSRLKTYIDLHNSVRRPLPSCTNRKTDQLHQMMLAQSQPATASANNDLNATVPSTDAAHIASTLLTAHAKHADLPLMMRAHASLVLACSEREDCYDHMAEARDCIKLAVQEGVLGKEQGESVLGVTGKLMGLKEGREGESSESEDEVEGECEEGDDSLP